MKEQTEGSNLPAQTADNLPTTNPAQNRQVEIATMEDMVVAVEKAKELGDVSNLQVGTVNLKMEYLSFEEVGQTIRRVFIGFTLRESVDPVTGESKGMLPAAQLYDPQTETINICMQKVLVGVLYETGYPRGAAVQITYKGDKKGKSGLKYGDFDIRGLVPVEDKKK